MNVATNVLCGTKWDENMLKIFFCFPYRGVGGVSLLFLRIAEELTQKGLAECYLIDYHNGFMAKNRSDEGVKLLEYSEGKKVLIPDDAVAVFQSMTPWSIFPWLQLSPKTRILFWNCHPFNLIPTLPGLRRQMQSNTILGYLMLHTILRPYWIKMVRLTNQMLAKESLVFMDSTNLKITKEYLGIHVNTPSFVPIPALPSTQKNKCNDFDGLNNVIRVAWIGRIVDFKYFILKRVLHDLAKLNEQMSSTRIFVTVVGTGEYSDRLSKIADKYAGLSIVLKQHLPPDQIDRFLSNEVDLLMAMGTSALEGARLGVPTILLDLSYREVPEGYIYHWLYERKGYTLAENISQEHIKLGNHSLAEKVDELMNNNSHVSSSIQEYFKRNHSLDKVALLFLEKAGRVRCTWGELVELGLMKRGFLYSLFNQLRRGHAK
jgi:glycosyltransferase involved in cell wall biosynthesis